MRKINLEKMIEDIVNNSRINLVCDNCDQPLSLHRLVATEIKCPNYPGWFRSKQLEAPPGSFPPFI